MEAKALRLLGLARRAGRLACGTVAVTDAAGRAQLFLLAADAGHSAKRGAERLARQAGTPLIHLTYTKEALGRAAGRGTCAVAAVTDKGFSRGIRDALQMEGTLGEYCEQIPHT
ncbi:MAG: L7Ae/L30e/S12e/Gadd45 family ribosomal protein [Oscillospiraceae bacterium]|jgi:ribosomal protein L7Ae-like RNA K-turn-binding protein|nr:L7Ae/L30e/S12e/Gadd45 family ribosomal protein [Oscillospiraceae bacterium]